MTEKRLKDLEERVSALTGDYWGLLDHYRDGILLFNAILVRITTLLDAGDTEAAADYTNEVIERFSAWSIDQMLDEIMAQSRGNGKEGTT